MNTADYLSTTDYPVTTQGLDFIQNQILCLEQMAAAFGDGNWILSGMTEDAEGNLTPGVVALVENSKATVVNFTQGGVSASDLKSKRFRVDSATNALPQRTYQFLIEDPDGEITNLDRIDIHELAEQIKDNRAAIEQNRENIAKNALAFAGTRYYMADGNIRLDFFRQGNVVHVWGAFDYILFNGSRPLLIGQKYRPKSTITLPAFSGDYGIGGLRFSSDGIIRMDASSSNKTDTVWHISASYVIDE